ncbi:DUF1801 domain-containing protein [Actinotalea ferrariae]|uniref:DUF1801 domain-containing protein n=1 Tax=Actinotalea ferrariae TaxID=1386098 RepID=UPI001C8BB948|nr:DUF1801 domain-containing protein [Actinotalea ferrariae]MBX9244877.1 DUF1801 domain-containing protein [Actinotalea ferrariae]
MAARSDENKTQATTADVGAFVDAVEPPSRREDARTVLELMRRATGREPVMWGPSIIGFGSYHYRYASGREGDAQAAGFSPRKASTTVYFADGFDDYAEDLARLGPHTTSVSCLYLKKLDGVDLAVLEDMVRRSYARVSSGAWPEEEQA